MLYFDVKYYVQTFVWLRFSKIDLRYQMLKEKFGDEVISSSYTIDPATLPPCRRSFKQHVRRCNYQVAI